VRFRFASKKLEVLYATEAGAKKYPRAVVTAFFDVMAAIGAASDERDIYALKSLHFEALKGDRLGQRSIRLNRQYRLILRIETDPNGKTVVVIDIADYH
jgi:proteic killer suppression protein